VLLPGVLVDEGRDVQLGERMHGACAADGAAEGHDLWTMGQQPLQLPDERRRVRGRQLDVEHDEVDLALGAAREGQKLDSVAREQYSMSGASERCVEALTHKRRLVCDQHGPGRGTHSGLGPHVSCYRFSVGTTIGFIAALLPISL